MTTLRDAFAEFIDGYYYGTVSGETVRQDVDAFLKAMADFPEPARLELAALLNPRRPIETAPQSEEILAWHICGKTWHQVTWTGEYFASRWNEAYHQFRGDFAGWLPLPTPQSEDK